MTHDDLSESPLEKRFLHAALKYLAKETKLQQQVEAATEHGLFRLDMTIESESGRPVGIELDGRDFHDSLRDLWRDAAILKAGVVDRILRISGKYVFRYPSVVWSLVGALEPWCIAPRESAVIDHLLHADGLRNLRYWVRPYGAEMMFDVFDPRDAEEEAEAWEGSEWLRPAQVWVRRRSLATEDVQRVWPWLEANRCWHIDEIIPLAERDAAL